MRYELDRFESSLDDLLRRIVPHIADKTLLALRRQQFAGALAAQLPDCTIVDVGPLARGTALRPASRLELLLYLDPQRTPRDPSRIEPTVHHVLRALAALEPSTQPTWQRPQARGIEFEYRDLTVDLLPAFRSFSGTMCSVLDFQQQRCIDADPEALVQHIQAQHARTDRQLGPLVQLAQYLNESHRVGVDPLHLELLVAEIHTSPAPTLLWGLRTVLRHLPDALRHNLSFPIAVGPMVERGLTESQRSGMASGFEQLQQQVEAAIAALQGQRSDVAETFWKRVFPTAEVYLG